MHGNIGAAVTGEQVSLVEARQRECSDCYLEMEDPVCDALNLASTLDKVMWQHKEQGAIAEDVWHELDTIVRTLRANLGIAAASYLAA